MGMAGNLGDGEPPPGAATSGAASGDECELAETMAFLEGDSVWDDPAATEGRVIVLLDIVQSMGTLYHEHLDAVLAWPWRLFCAQWRRMIAQNAKQRLEQMRREAERREADAKRELAESHQQAWGR